MLLTEILLFSLFGLDKFNKYFKIEWIELSLFNSNRNDILMDLIVD